MKAALITLLLVSYIAAPALLPASPHDDHDHLDHDHHEHDHDHAHDHGDEYHDHDHDDHDHEEGLNFSPEVLKEFGIELGTVGPGSMSSKYTFPGEIRFNQERVAMVSPRLSGTITALHVRLGDRVERGQLLATLESTETLGVFNVVSPVAGTVVEREGTLGQTVDAGTMLFTVADTSALWADLRIYLHDLGQLRIGLPVVLESAGATYQGRIDYIAPTIDPHTRTGLVRVVVDNSSGHWRPGQFVSATVRMDEEEAALVVPKTALITVDGRTVVFVLSDEGFEVRPITTGRCDSVSCEVVEGLHHGETIAVRNVISLKAELGKASFGGHHGHVH